MKNKKPEELGEVGTPEFDARRAAVRVQLKTIMDDPTQSEVDRQAAKVYFETVGE